jgi:hypothetical protein
MHPAPMVCRQLVRRMGSRNLRGEVDLATYRSGGRSRWARSLLANDLVALYEVGSYRQRPGRGNFSEWSSSPRLHRPIVFSQPENLQNDPTLADSPANLPGRRSARRDEPAAFNMLDRSPGSSRQQLQNFYSMRALSQPRRPYFRRRRARRFSEFGESLSKVASGDGLQRQECGDACEFRRDLGLSLLLSSITPLSSTGLAQPTDRACCTGPRSSSHARAGSKSNSCCCVWVSSRTARRTSAFPGEWSGSAFVQMSGLPLVELQPGGKCRPRSSLGCAPAGRAMLGARQARNRRAVLLLPLAKHRSCPAPAPQRRRPRSVCRMPLRFWKIFISARTAIHPTILNAGRWFDRACHRQLQRPSQEGRQIADKIGIRLPRVQRQARVLQYFECG